MENFFPEREELGIKILEFRLETKEKKKENNNFNQAYEWYPQDSIHTHRQSFFSSKL
jgi:hypothetical protein